MRPRRPQGVTVAHLTDENAIGHEMRGARMAAIRYTRQSGHDAATWVNNDGTVDVIDTTTAGAR